MVEKTRFAPAERATDEHLEHASQLLSKAGIVNHLTHVIPSILMVLNKERQVVYSNQRLQDLLNLKSGYEVLGLRPGEILDCIHARNNCGGCGTTEFCSQCGAVKAILKSQDEKVGVEAECRITTCSGQALELKVWASPFQKDETDYTVFSIVDIQDKKRRENLEQTFYHDMNNLLSSITGHSGLIPESRSDRETEELIQSIQAASREMISEITGHRKLLLAENDELLPSISADISSEELVHELIGLYPSKPIQVASNSEHFTVSSDRTLLFRVLLNMLKNALEATPENGTVTISCRQESDSGIFSIHNPQYMPRETQLQMFQRSFSTKGKGRGIGTYSMRLFGEKYLKGKVGFTTSQQNGTTFYIAVPLRYPEYHPVSPM